MFQKLLHAKTLAEILQIKGPLEMAIDKSKGGKRKRKTVMSEIDLMGKSVSGSVGMI